MMFSAIPDAIDPFLLLFIEKAGLSGAMITTRWGMGARLMIRTVAVYDLSSW